MLTDSYIANEETFPTCGYYLYDTVQIEDYLQQKDNLKKQIQKQEPIKFEVKYSS